MCWWYRKYTPGNRELERLEKNAREAKKGLWVAPVQVPPWEWRKRTRERRVATGLQFIIRDASFVAYFFSPGLRSIAPRAIRPSDRLSVPVAMSPLRKGLTSRPNGRSFSLSRPG
jgi:hypothetical protein